ncbi:MAG: YhdH/YhfP family quinone oxidoreductase [Desulfobulbaceae bacterium]|nr:YhdH/YhfP family quinone oxidoreductase [Desulfobulbaceae bacterium]
MQSISFQSLVVHEDESRAYRRSIELRETEDLPAGDVLVRVQFSSLNYKDALSATGNRGVTKRYPHTPGIDAAGVVAWSSDEAFAPGDEVLVSGYDLGMNTPGGFGQYIRVPSLWVLAKPDSIPLIRSMQIGTAGFTAAQCVSALLDQGVLKTDGPILVTGATGGVGSVAVSLLSSLGFAVTAVTGKEQEHKFLSTLGAKKILSREQATVGTERLLLRERWAGVIDTVGGEILATAIKSTRYEGTVTCCGNASSGELPINVYPFILRGVKLIGIDSAQCPLGKRKKIWKKLAGEWQIPYLEEMSRTIKLNELSASIDQMLKGGVKGRVVVDLREDV